MEIVPADIHDGDHILMLQRLAYQSEATLYNDPTLPPLRQTIEELHAEFATHHVLKAVEAGQIVGSVRASLHDHTCFIGRLIVHPVKQRRGIGTALMKAIEQCYPTAERFELFTGSRSAHNMHLYQKLGYTIYTTKVLSERVTLVYLEKYR